MMLVEVVKKKWNKGRKELCKRFNKGRCSYGLACIFDHRCSVPKCRKFGHGAHMCRLREDKTDKNTNKPVQELANPKD